MGKTRSTPLGLILSTSLSLGYFSLITPATASPATQPWAFAAFADNRAANERPPDTFEGVLAEIRDMKFPAKDDSAAVRFPPIEFAVGCGDIKMAADQHNNWNIWKNTFKGADHEPCFFPVIGNWDNGDEEFNKTVILPAQRNVVGADPQRYYVDWRNVRLIVSSEPEYVENLIKSAPKNIQHVFIADHYPVFPRFAHEAAPTEKEVEFWGMLVKHRDKVRAYFCGHTHHYSRLRVADPSGPAKGATAMVDEPDGIYQIDCGNAGRPSHGENVTTLVEIRIDGPNVGARVLQAPHTRPSEFKIVEEWNIAGTTKPAK